MSTTGTTSEARHTELPWQWDEDCCEIFDSQCNPERVAYCSNPRYSTEKRQANAAYIVRACNSFDVLVAALEACAKEFEERGIVPPCLTQARAALALSKGDEI